MSPSAEHAVPPVTRLNAGARIVRTGDRVIVSLGARRMALKGAAAQDIASKLLPLLDGTRTADELAARSGIDRPSVDAVLRLLDERRLLATETGPPPRPALAPETAAYYASHHRALGAHDGAGSLVRALRRGTVLLVGPNGLVDPLAELLAESGIRAERHRAGDGPHEPSRRAALVVAIEAGPSASTETARRLSVEESVPLLRVCCSSSHIEIGPYITADAPNCPRCLARSRREAGWKPFGPSGFGPAAVDLACGFAANEIVAFLAGAATTLGRYEVRRIDLEAWSSDSCVVPPYRDCPAVRIE